MLLSGNATVFEGNVDKKGIVTIVFDEPILATEVSPSPSHCLTWVVRRAAMVCMG